MVVVDAAGVVDVVVDRVPEDAEVDVERPVGAEEDEPDATGVVVVDEDLGTKLVLKPLLPVDEIVLDTSPFVDKLVRPLLVLVKVDSLEVEVKPVVALVLVEGVEDVEVERVDDITEVAPVVEARTVVDVLVLLLEMAAAVDVVGELPRLIEEAEAVNVEVEPLPPEEVIVVAELLPVPMVEDMIEAEKPVLVTLDANVVKSVDDKLALPVEVEEVADVELRQHVAVVVTVDVANGRLKSVEVACGVEAVETTALNVED